MAEVKLKKLTIHKYPNVAPGTELTFNDTWNVLLGRNGTGKTTLLKLIAMVVKDNFRALKETAFSIEYALSFPRAELVVSIENSPAERTLRTSLNKMAWTAAPADKWSYRVELNTDRYRCSLSSSPSGTTYDVPVDARDHEDRTVLRPFDESSLFSSLVRIFNITDPSRTQDSNAVDTMVAALSLWNTGRFDESLIAFEILCGAAHGENGSSLPAAQFTALMLDARVFSTVKSNFWPESISRHLADISAEAWKAGSLRLPCEHAPFLRQAVKLFGFEDSEMVLNLVKKDRGETQLEQRTYSDFSFLFTLPGGSQVTQDALSYGQKRLLAFLYYVACNGEIVIADELVNGMHYDWIEACIEAIVDRQSFLTSQNPLLLDFLSFSSPEEVQKSFIQCSHAPRPEGHGRAQFAWHNLSAEDAATFFRAYEAGVQHVSEILKTKGMW